MTNPLRARRSVGTVVAASLISAVCGVIQTFWIPRLLPVDSFGYWRTFLLYMGYAGLLHLGLVDGALLLWSRDGAASTPTRGILNRSLRFLALEHLGLLALALLALLLPTAPALAHILLALAVYALLFNLLGLLQVYFQAHLRFTPVAFGMSASGVLFVLLLAALAAFHATTVDHLLLAYLASWAITMLALLLLSARTQPVPDITPAPTPSTTSAWPLGLSYIAAGWPIVLANTGFGLMQSADRVTVNLTRSLHDFAIYSLSQSTIYVPITILTAVSRVAFSYLARTAHDGRAGVYRSSTRALTLGWMLLLPYYFAVELVVQRFLPRYTPGLPAGRILLLSVLFLSLIQIVQLNTFSLAGLQRRFFAGSLVAVAVAFATAWTGSRILGSLSAVAWSQVLTAALWWLANELYLRRRTNLRTRDLAQILAGFAISALVLEWTESLGKNFAMASAIYLLLIVPACLLLFPEERKALFASIGAGESKA